MTHAAKLLLTLVLPMLAGAASAKDFTAEVAARSDLDERVAAFCAANCQGNERKGELVRVDVRRLDATRFAVEAEAHLRNRHHQVAPPILGGIVGKSVTLFDYTAIVVADGTLDGRTCALLVENIRIKDDRLGLGKALEQERGKVYRIPECRKLLVGL